MRILLGGTFSVLHEGHKKLIKYGLELGELYIGITSDNFKFNKAYKVPPYEERKKRVLDYVKSLNKDAEISELNDPFGSTLSEDFQGMVISNETLEFSIEINSIRRSRGIKPLTLFNVGEVLAEDLMPIKSERILNGEIDDTGKRLRPVKVSIASENSEKIAGVKAAFNYFIKGIEFNNFSTETGLSQPFGDEIFEIGKKRCQGIKEADFCVSVEAGIMKIFDRYFDIHAAIIYDKYNKISLGISSGVPLNINLVNSLKAGKDLNQVMAEITGLPDVGKKGGAVFYFSKGVKLRRELVREAVISSLMERISYQIPIVREHVVPLL